MSVFIIAEAGVNHNGSIQLAKELIDVAVNSGANAVKFQTFNANRQVTLSAKKAKYQQKTTDKSETQHSMLSKLELSEENHFELIEYCKKKNIIFMSSAFDIESVDLLEKLGQKCFKVPSGEITNLPYLRYLGKLDKEIILSTGMSNNVEIQAAINELTEAGTPLFKITILQCTSEYPSPMNEANLMVIGTFNKEFDVRVGYSDHTLGIESAIAAVALGAKVIEKHFTVDKNLPGPDHQASLEPSELTNMVKAIRNIEMAMGNGVKNLSPCEVENVKLARKSIVAKKEISIGDIFTSDNLTTKRPGYGISPMKWDEIIGQKSKKRFSKDDLIDI